MSRYKPFVPTEEQKQLVEKVASLGLRWDQIATLVINPETQKAISKNTLHEYFPEELERGIARSTAQVSANLFRIATSQEISGPVVTACIFWMKCKGYWRTTDRIEHTGADGAPLEHEAVKALQSKIDRFAGSSGETVVPFKSKQG